MKLIIDSHQDIYSAITARKHYNDQTNMDSIKNILSIVHASLFIEPQDSHVFRERRDGQSLTQTDFKTETYLQLLFYQKLIANDPSLMLITDRASLQESLSKKKTGVILHFEGAESITTISFLEYLYSRGLRSIGLVWNRKNAIGTPACENSAEGLTPFGKALVKKMIDLSMIIDVAHLNMAGVEDVHEICKENGYPFINSHVASYQLCPLPRNMRNEHLYYVAASGGMVGVFAAGAYLTRNKKPTITDYLLQINYISSIVGSDAIGIGSDFGGIGESSGLCESFAKTDDFPTLEKEMKRSGFTDELAKKILGGNYLSFYQRIWK